MHRKRKRIEWMGLVVALGIIATACGTNASAQGGSDGLWVQIVSPADGTTVSSTFSVKLDASVPLGDPSTGEHHVHLCFDGANCDAEYSLVYGNSMQVTGLTPGPHTIEASLRNADHSAAGATDSISVTVSGSASPRSPSSGGTTPPPGRAY